MLTSDPAGTFVAYESPERTLQVFRSDGVPDGPQITPGFRTGCWPVALSPERGFLWTANFDRGTLRCFDWRTGDLRWERPGVYKKLASLHCCGSSMLLVTQYASRGTVGPVRVLDQESGAEISTLSAVNTAFSQSDSRWIVATRRGCIEFYHELSGAPQWSFETGTLDVSVALDDDRALISQAGGLVKCFDLVRGVQEWTFDCGEGQSLACPALPHGTGVAFGLRRHCDVGGRGSPIFIDASNGTVLRTEPELQFPIQAIVDRGRAAIATNGILLLPSLEWIPHLQPIR